MIRSLLLSSVLFAMSMPAHATPFVLDLEADGPPVHGYFPGLADFFVDAEASDRWTWSDVARPPAGTSSFDVRIALPESYEVAPHIGSASSSYIVLCGWGDRTESAGAQFVEITDFTAFTPEERDDDAVLVITGPNTGFNPNSVSLRVDGSMVPGSRFLTVHFDVPSTAFTPTPVLAGTGDCQVRFKRSGADIPDQTVVRPLTTLGNTSAGLATDAIDAYLAGFVSPTPALDAAEVETNLEPLMDALVDGGCLTEALIGNPVAGAYGGTVILGKDSEGDLQNGERKKGTPAFGLDLGDGTEVGENAGLFSRHTLGRKIYAESADGGFFAGRWKRIKGKRGVFYGIQGTCDGPQDPSTALAAWFDGPLP
jgi:hypothetical protein